MLRCLGHRSPSDPAPKLVGTHKSNIKPTMLAAAGSLIPFHTRIGTICTQIPISTIARTPFASTNSQKERVFKASFTSKSVSNQQKWDTLGAERSWAGWRSGELPDGPIVASPPFDGLSLHLLPAL